MNDTKQSTLFLHISEHVHILDKNVYLNISEHVHILDKNAYLKGLQKMI